MSSAVPRKDSKNGTWWFIVELPVRGDGRRRQAKRRGFPTKAAAQAALDELRVSGRHGTFVPPDRQTVGEYLTNEWLPAARRELADSTWESYARNVRNHLVPHIGAIRLQALDGVHIDLMYTELLTSGRMRGQQSAGLKPRTVRYIHTILHAALDAAVRSNRVARNACDQATPPSAKESKPPEMKVWTGLELQQFLSMVDGTRYGCAWFYLATTGCRRGESLGLRWRDVDLDDMTPTASIRQQVIPLKKPSGRGTEPRIVPRTKGGEPRVIELDTRTVAMLRTWRRLQAEERLLLGEAYEDHGLVFPRPDGRPFHPEAFSKTFDRRVLAAHSSGGLPIIRLHDLRHTWATLALKKRVDVKVVSERLGHSSPVITWTIYQHVVKGMQSDAAEAVADAIFGAS
jgi:integrase